MIKDKKDIIIFVLILVVAVLLLLLTYVFVVRPTLNGFVAQGQIQGYNYAIQQIFSLSSECKQIPVTLENKTINLIAVECFQENNI